MHLSSEHATYHLGKPKFQVSMKIKSAGPLTYEMLWFSKGRLPKQLNNFCTLPETNVAPENQWMED